MHMQSKTKREIKCTFVRICSFKIGSKNLCCTAPALWHFGLKTAARYRQQPALCYEPLVSQQHRSTTPAVDPQRDVQWAECAAAQGLSAGTIDSPPGPPPATPPPSVIAQCNSQAGTTSS
jgi:hypothetical protein